MIEEKEIKRELRNLIESNALMIAETKRIWSNKEDITDYEKGRAEGIILVGLDMNDNLNRFANNLKFKEKSRGGEDENS